ncbi:TPA: hypothetical protein N2B41_005901 [Pseudomonas aeruginosa]|nr:hypothetical protein [Pseudomonas aeruginosa]HCL3697305.1 hypothetical protein [Pseudomonas aeruginosa]
MKTQITSFVLDEHQVLDLKKLVDIDRRWMEFTHGPWRLRGLVIVAGEVLREILKKPVFRETAALYPAWLLGCIFRERTFSDHPKVTLDESNRGTLAFAGLPAWLAKYF